MTMPMTEGDRQELQVRLKPWIYVVSAAFLLLVLRFMVLQVLEH